MNRTFFLQILFTKTPITEVFQELSNETISDSDPLLKGDIETVVKILDTVKSRTSIEGWNATDIAEVSTMSCQRNDLSFLLQVGGRSRNKYLM